LFPCLHLLLELLAVQVPALLAVELLAVQALALLAAVQLAAAFPDL
jgi:hypothetical protein